MSELRKQQTLRKINFNLLIFLISEHYTEKSFTDNGYNRRINLVNHKRIYYF
jgi:hypothetical protein